MSNQRYGPWSGVQPRPAAQHLRNEYLSSGVDVDMSRGTLKPLRTDRKVSSITTVNDRTLFATDCCIKAMPGCERIAEDRQSCNRVFVGKSPAFAVPTTGTPAELCTGLSTTWGWPCDIPAPTVTYSGISQPDRTTEPRSYIYTFENKFGEESQPSAPSPVVALHFATTATIAGFMTILAAYGAVKIHIFSLIAGYSATTGGGTDGSDEYLLVATLPITQLMFNHNPQVHPLGRALETEDFVPIPVDATDPQHWGGNSIAFIANGALRFTEPWNYSLAPVKYTYLPKDTLIRIATTQEFVYMLTCGQPEVVKTAVACDMSGARAASVVNDSFPLIGRHSVAAYENSVIFASVMGLVHLSGANAKTISEDVFTQEQYDALQPQTMIGVCYQNFYFGATDTACFRMEIPGGPKSGHQGTKFTWLSIRPTAFFVTTDDRLLYSDATGTHEFGQGDSFKPYTAELNEVFHASQRVHGAVRVISKPGTLRLTQTAIADNAREYDETISVSVGGVYRFSRRMGAGVRYKLVGDAEVSSLTVGDSVASISSRD